MSRDEHSQKELGWKTDLRSGGLNFADKSLEDTGRSTHTHAGVELCVGIGKLSVVVKRASDSL